MLSCQQKKVSHANLHIEEKMASTILGMFGSDTSLQQKILVASQVSTGGYLVRTAEAPRHHPLLPGL